MCLIFKGVSKHVHFTFVAHIMKYDIGYFRVFRFTRLEKLESFRFFFNLWGKPDGSFFQQKRRIFSLYWSIYIRFKITKTKNLLCLWKIFSIYKMSYLWNVPSMKCPIYEMSFYKMSFYEMSQRHKNRLWIMLEEPFMLLKLVCYSTVSCYNKSESYLEGFYVLFIKENKQNYSHIFIFREGIY